MIRFLPLLPCLFFCLTICPVRATDMNSARKIVRFEPNSKIVLRNPLTGWGLYADVVWNMPDPDAWWKGLEPGVPFATHFYFRCRWSTLEPEEGKYAWKHDERFRKMIAEAEKRGLKLAFRVIVDSQDNAEQATPDFVRKAGAKGRAGEGNSEKFWNPDITDPIFQKKFSNFIQAFGEEFDDPQRVDYIDGNGLGRWGEQHHMNVPNDQKEAVLEWICSTYASAFKQVLLVYCFGSEFELDRELRICVNKYGYIPRRDGLGSCWFSDPQKEFIQQHFPRLPLIGESCYWALDGTTAWQNDRAMNFKTKREILERSIEDAIRYHANTFDLRNPDDVRFWMQNGPDLIEKFIVRGGYRLYPATVDYPTEYLSEKTVVIRHRWKNSGAGVCPNANPRWNKKYKVAFSLFSNEKESKDQGNPLAIYVDPQAEPSGWTKEADGNYESMVRWNIAPGTYRLAVGIVDTTRNNRPGILCSVEKPGRTDGWIDIGEMIVVP